VEKARVNLEYMYGFTLKKEGKGVLAFRFDDPDRAIAALAEEEHQPRAERGSVQAAGRLTRSASNSPWSAFISTAQSHGRGGACQPEPA